MKRQRRDYKKEIRAWAVRDGNDQVIIALATAGMSIAMAQKLVYGTYKSNPKQDAVEMIEEAMAGFDKNAAS